MVREASGDWNVPDFAANYSRDYIATHSQECVRFDNGTSSCAYGLLNSFQVQTSYFCPL